MGDFLCIPQFRRSSELRNAVVYELQQKRTIAAGPHRKRKTVILTSLFERIGVVEKIVHSQLEGSQRDIQVQILHAERHEDEETRLVKQIRASSDVVKLPPMVYKASNPIFPVEKLVNQEAHLHGGRLNNQVGHLLVRTVRLNDILERKKLEQENASPDEQEPKLPAPNEPEE